MEKIYTQHNIVTHPSYASGRARSLYRTTQVIWFVLGLIEALLAIRFILKLLGASPVASFSDFIYRVTAPLTIPFSGMFREPVLTGSAFEWTTLLAMAVYALVAWGIIRLIAMSRPVSTSEADVKLRSQDE